VWAEAIVAILALLTLGIGLPRACVNSRQHILASESLLAVVSLIVCVSNPGRLGVGQILYPLYVAMFVALASLLRTTESTPWWTGQTELSSGSYAVLALLARALRWLPMICGRSHSVFTGPRDNLGSFHNPG
jgi:hypothetical protein